MKSSGILDSMSVDERRLHEVCNTRFSCFHSVCMTEICSGLCSRDFIFGASGMEQNFTGYFRLGHSSKGEILRLLEQFFYRLDWMLMLSAN